MLKKSFLLALSLLVLVLTGCPTPTPGGEGSGTGSTTSDKGVIEGQVTMQDGTAAANTILHLEMLIEGRTVSINRAIASRGESRVSPAETPPASNEQWWKTDEQGKYRITDISPGLYSIKAVLADTLGAGYSNITIEAGSTTVQNITLTATGTISGKVSLDGKTTTLPGTVVYTAGLSYKAFAAPDGTFRIDGVPVGSYEIHFSRDNYVTVVEQNVVVTARQETVVAAKTLVMEPLKLIECSKPDGTVYASMNKNIQFYFDKSVDPTSLLSSSIKLLKGTEELAIGKPEVRINVVYFSIGDYLNYNTDYILKLNGIASFEGNRLAGEQTVSFRTHGAPPKLIKVTPAPNSENIPLDTVFTLQFDREMDTKTLTKNQLSLYSYRDRYNKLPAQFTYDKNTNTISIKPESPLEKGKKYELSFWSHYIKDINGITMDDTQIPSFSTNFNYNFTTIPLDITSQAGQWIELSLSNSAGTLLSFDLTAGKNYELLLDDYTDGSGKYTVDARIEEHGNSSYFWRYVDSAYKTPIKFTAKTTEKLLIRIFTYDNKAGNCAILIRESAK